MARLPASWTRPAFRKVWSALHAVESARGSADEPLESGDYDWIGCSKRANVVSMSHATQPDFEDLDHQAREALVAIAKANLIETLETRRCGDDFFETAVWSVRQRMTDAYLLGVEHGRRAAAKA